MTTAAPQRLVDLHKREINYLRISVTDRCNLRCLYCAPVRPQQIPKDNLLTLEEIERLVCIGIGLGIRKVRLTGGEPLVRKGVPGLIQRLCGMESLEDVSLTTNGTLIHRYADQLLEAGLSRLNISLDTLDRRKYKEPTGVDLFSQVWDGLHMALGLGFDPIKINMVVMKGFNDNEIEQMAALSTKHPVHVRFIEYMPIGTDPSVSHHYFVPVSEIENRLRQMGRLVPVARREIDGPASRYRFEGAPGEVGLISAMSAHFCGSCNRLRLTADGKLRPCLLADSHVDLFEAVRGKATDEVLVDTFKEAVRLKEKRHRLSFESGRALATKMISIGG